MEGRRASKRLAAKKQAEEIAEAERRVEDAPAAPRRHSIARNSKAQRKSKAAHPQIAAPAEQRKDSIRSLAIGLEAQERSLDALLASFKSTLQGGSCVLSGRSGSGKTLVVDRIRRRCFPRGDDSISTMNVDCWEETTSIAALNQLLTELRRPPEGMVPKLIVVDHFERFNTRRDQKLLYSVLNASQERSWFVIMVCCAEDAIDSLEKRIKSRLSKTKINFNVPFSLPQVEEAFFTFLERIFEHDEDNPLNGLREDQHRLRALLGRIHSRHPGLGCFKQLALAYSTTYQVLSLRGRSSLDVLEHCAEALCPRDEMMPVLGGLSLRQLCLLRCIALLQRRSAKLEFTYRDVFRGYSQFCNDYEKAMLVEEHALFKDIDELVRLSILSTRGRQSTSGQQEFRRVSLDVEIDPIYDSLMARPLSTNIRTWLDGG